MDDFDKELQRFEQVIWVGYGNSWQDFWNMYCTIYFVHILYTLEAVDLHQICTYYKMACTVGQLHFEILTYLI